MSLKRYFNQHSLFIRLQKYYNCNKNMYPLPPPTWRWGKLQKSESSDRFVLNRTIRTISSTVARWCKQMVSVEQRSVSENNFLSRCLIFTYIKCFSCNKEVYTRVFAFSHRLRVVNFPLGRWSVSISALTCAATPSAVTVGIAGMRKKHIWACLLFLLHHFVSLTIEGYVA